MWRDAWVSLTIQHYNENWLTSKIGGDHSTYEPNTQVQEWLKFDNPVTQDIIIECQQFARKLWPEGHCTSQKWFPKTYQTYLYNDAQYPQQITTHPGSASCTSGYGGEILHLKNLAPGTYNLGIWDYANESDVGHGIWYMKTYAS